MKRQSTNPDRVSGSGVSVKRLLFSFPVHTLDRGPLNASIFYTLKESWMFGVEAVNLTEEAI